MIISFAVAASGSTANFSHNRNAKTSFCKMNNYDKQHLLNLQRYLAKIDAIYKAAIKEGVNISGTIKHVNADGIFSFDDYPITHKRINELLQQLKDNLQVCIVNGVRSEWTLANNKNNELANRVFGKNKSKLTPQQERRYYSNNDAARVAFEQRKENGLDLSQRVWEYSKQFKQELELGLDVGIRNGRSADEMSRDIRQYLKQPDKLFRRVRDEHGNLKLSQAAKAYHPGQGVYRSSYKNARRLTSTETNIAYRTADHLRYQQLDFVVGIEVHLSGNHTLNGKKFHDICDELQGKYPKEFKFTGWHPQCRCYATSILKTPEEIAEDNRRLLRGEPVTDDSVNAVRDVPPAFKQWLADNAERIASAKSLPYFLKDNPEYVNIEAPDGNSYSLMTNDNGSPKQSPTSLAKGEFVELTEDEMMSRLRQLSKDFTHEEAFAVLADGRMYHKVGGSKEVRFTDDEAEMLKNAAVYHNHGDAPLSPEDISFSIKYSLKSISAITREYTSIAKLTKRTQKINYAEVKSIYEQCGDEIEKKMKQMNSREYYNTLIRFQRFNVEALCRRLNIKYEERQTKSNT